MCLSGKHHAISVQYLGECFFERVGALPAATELSHTRGVVSAKGTEFILFVGRDGIPVRRLDSQSREPGFKSHCGRFEPLASLITPRCHSSLSCINEYLAIQTVVEM